jgi:hypothetical protein
MLPQKNWSITMHNRFFSVLIPLFLSVLILLTACLDQNSQKENETFAMAHEDDLPAEVQKAAISVREAYQFAAANPEILTQIPCYCGCGAIGHTSNYACYVSERGSDGLKTYDLHALGCSICVDITQDTMRLLKQGKTLPEIRTYIDATYSQFGPSNLP